MAKKTKKSNLSVEERLEQALIPNWDEPYKLPPNWCWVRVDAIASIYTGNSINERIKEEKYAGKTDGLVYLATKDIGFDSTINYETNVCIPLSDGFKVAPKYSTLLCIEGGSAGRKIGFITQDICFVNKLCAFVPHAKINPKYLYYVIQSNVFKKQFDAKKHGLIGGVSIKEVSSIFIPFAPIDIQYRIVDLIESAFDKLEMASGKAQEVVDGFETRKAAILHKAFTGKLTAKWRSENEISIQTWDKQKLKSCGAWCGGGTPSMQHPEYWENGNLLWITAKDMKSDIITDTKMLTNMLGVKNSSATYIEKPSILFVMRSGILRRTLPISMVKIPFTVNQDLKVLTPDELNLDYLFWACKAFERDILKKCMKSGTTVESINSHALLDYELPIPQKREQEEIVCIIEALIAKEVSAKASAEAIIDQIDTMKKAILARAFRGELGTNDPSEESAVELLKQVLNTASEPNKSAVKRTVIPKSLESRMKTDLERKIIKLYIQNKVDVLSIDRIMGVSSKKFEIMEALRNLQQRCLLEKQNDKYKLLG